MSDQQPAPALIIRLAVPEDLEQIDYLDSFTTSPPRDIHRDLHKYFGSVDPSTHEHTLIFLLEINGTIAGKAELMLPPQETVNATGYIKRVVIHPNFQGKGLAQQLLSHTITYARSEHKLAALDLHVWEQNQPAIHLYEMLGFELQHRELYYRLKL
ncbi:MAG TPA: GNAT family N-acetyltransferase [Ktedonobacteraceae bacterium]|jgi:ribosomal protein S18 acetylase RimI-like enzyme